MTKHSPLLMPALMLFALAACKQKLDDPAATPAAAPNAAAPSGVAAPSAARLLRTRAYQCESGGRMELKDYDDGSTRVDINAVTHVLRAVNVASGGLLQGDNISVRLFDDQATASEGGVVLYAGCRKTV